MKISELPRDLLEEILCRVPTIYLLRLRTCKQWNRLFNDTRFSRKHFDKAAKQFRVLALTRESRVCLANVNLHNGTPSAEITSELSLFDYHNSNPNQEIMINKVFHCDGLLLCTIRKEARILIWNPCTGQTKWIQTGENRRLQEYVLGYSQDNISCNKSYKNYRSKNQVFEISDINSNPWRNLDVTPILDSHFVYSYYCVSLKGKTYWLAYDRKEEQLGLISFDYTTERFERLGLPYRSALYESQSISVVGEEKLSLLLQRQDTSRKEIWVTNKIDDETKEMSWTKLLEVEDSRYSTWPGSFFLSTKRRKSSGVLSYVYQAAIWL